MKYIRKIPAADKEISSKLIADGWTRLKEPSNLGMATLMSIPFMITNGIIFVTIVYYLYPPLREFFNLENEFSVVFTINWGALLYVFLFYIFMMIHEFLHACFIPKFLTSDNVYWGITAFNGFVYTTERVKRDRFLIVSIMPFIILSILVPFILNIFGLFNWFTVFLCFSNALGSCVDILNICLVVAQVPREASIINNGFETYFK